MLNMIRMEVFRMFKTKSMYIYLGGNGSLCSFCQ